MDPVKRSCLPALAATGLVACTAPAPPEPGEVAEDASRTSRALDELSEAYADLAALVDRNPGEAVEWAQDDIENLGDFEYRIVEFARMPVEQLEAEFNAIGDERWEVFWMEPTETGLRVYARRSSISYLSRLPLSALVRLFSGNGQ
jgi:hypothetical protein